MKTTNNGTLISNHSTQPSHTSKLSHIGLTLTLTATLLCGLAASTAAQNAGVFKIVPERGFTIAPNVQTPMVLKTRPDAECTLHAAGDSDPAHTMKLYANGDGYVRVHVSARQETQEDLRVELDCASGGTVTTYPLRLRAGSSPTSDMPAPRTSVPTPKGSRILPALTGETARQFSDQDLLTLGYPARPDSVASPDRYADWLDLVSRPTTLLPAHSVSRSDISHSGNIQAGAFTSDNWSGYEAHHAKRSYVEVIGAWWVPLIAFGESNTTTYSSMWVGLDGDGTKDLVQAGTEQDYTEFWVFSFASYSTWTELLPNQPTAQDAGLSINPGDEVFVNVWIGDSFGVQNPNGAYAWFYLQDITLKSAVQISTPLSGTYYNGSEADWIVERPTVGGTLTELSYYNFAHMANAYASTTAGVAKPYNKIQNRQITMYENFTPQADNNKLSRVAPDGTAAMKFYWDNFH